MFLWAGYTRSHERRRRHERDSHGPYRTVFRQRERREIPSPKAKKLSLREPPARAMHGRLGTSGDSREEELEQLVFRVRNAAAERAAAKAHLVPHEVVVHPDGSAVATYDRGKDSARFESIAELLTAHGLHGVDLDPVD